MKKSKVWVEHDGGYEDAHSAILCPYARDFCSHYEECHGNSDCYRQGKEVFDSIEKLIHAVVFDGETQVAGILAEIHLAVKNNESLFLR